MYAPVVTIATVGDSHEGVLLRAIVERMGLVVQLVPTEAPSDLFDLLKQGHALPKIIIIAGPGDQHGLVFGTTGNAVPNSPRVDDSLTPSDFRGQIALQNQLVICTAHRSGRRAMAEVLMQGGAGAYLAPEGWPPPARISLFLHVFLHGVLLEQRSYENAMEHAHRYADAFTLYLG